MKWIEVEADDPAERISARSVTTRSCSRSLQRAPWTATALDSWAHLTFCARHAIEFVDRLREVADQAHTIAVEATRDDAPMGTLA